jgi:hypothetical protein
MKSITKIERDDYLIIPNPDLVNEYKSISYDYTVGSGELALFFGELQVNSILRVEGELNVLRGNDYISNIPPSGLSYNNIVVNVNNSATSLPTLNAGSLPITYSVSPSLPSGMSINSSTGVISGTPINSQSITSYTVTATNSVGNTTATISITVSSVIAPSGLSYNSYTTAIPLISTSVSYSPTLSAGTSPTYSVSPSLPSGLSLNTSNGIISGTTPSTSNDTTYTITATNGAGSTTASFRIRIVYVNTTMTVGNNIDGEGFGSIGLDSSASVGSLLSYTFRSGSISDLYAVVDSNGSSYLGINLAITYSVSNTDSASFKQIVWNGVTYLRSSLTYGTDGSTYTNWYNTGGTPPFNMVTFVSSGTPSTTPLIIE